MGFATSPAQGHRRRADAAQNVMTISALAMAFGAPLIGWLAGRFGKRPTLLVSLLVYGLAGLAGAYAPDFYGLLASRLLLGIASAGYVTVGVADRRLLCRSEGVRDRLLGWFAIVGGGGSLAVLYVAGVTGEGRRLACTVRALCHVAHGPAGSIAPFVITTVRQDLRPDGRQRTASSDSIWGAWGSMC
jgi:MFS family permease